MTKLIITSIITTFIVASFAPQSMAAISQSKSYKLSVTIPATVGILRARQSIRPVLKHDEELYSHLKVEEVKRGNEDIVLKTYVVK